MDNLAAVVNERDDAYELLETGKCTRRKMVWKKNVLDLWRVGVETEHYEPKYENASYLKQLRYTTKWMPKFKRLLREKGLKKNYKESKQRNREEREIGEVFGEDKVPQKSRG